MHYFLAMVALVAIWRHVRLQKVFAQIYMVVGSSILIGTTLLHWIMLLVRNVTVHRFGSRAQVYRAWWEVNEQGKATSISLLVQKRDGFTQSLMDHQAKEFLTWFDGPYGEPVDLSSYNNILLVASGMGIAAQVPYIRELLNHRPKYIFVAWELDDKTNLDWVYQWMDQLLLQDRDSYVTLANKYLTLSLTW
ncbi:hypothetical protein EYZ11_008378 [Aspergillus tanneri]|uniref:Ferric reductase NAD binding domain-containing protein n=1 Tax=Aspergillus tanneri TaxID=1220188 RepID=A0A4S3JAL3_9EURO|nr:hypothetical protein EYZ11_008378 [Aspergillus tanneri]